MHKRRTLRIGLILTDVVLLLVAGVVLPEPLKNMWVEHEPVAVAIDQAATEYIVFRSDEGLFTMMAALNAAGYDDENNSKGMHPVRLQVRADLARKNLPSRERILSYYKRGTINESKFIEWILCRSGPPDFSRRVDGWWVNLAPGFFFGFNGVLRDFDREAGIASLWKQVQPDYEAESARYRSGAAPAIERVFAYLRVRRPPESRIVILPNLLDAYGRGNGPAIGPVSYIVVGPSETPDMDLIQHEAMHPVINPLVDAHLGVIDKGQADRLFGLLRPRMPASYSTWDVILKESVIRALEVRLAPVEARAALISKERKQGFVLVRPLAEQLARYEQGDQGMDEYMPALLQSLDALNPDDLNAVQNF